MKWTWCLEVYTFSLISCIILLLHIIYDILTHNHFICAESLSLLLFYPILYCFFILRYIYFNLSVSFKIYLYFFIYLYSFLPASVFLIFLVFSFAHFSQFPFFRLSNLQWLFSYINFLDKVYFQWFGNLLFHS